MSNMSYCRFQNTERDLDDCIGEMRDNDDMRGMDLSQGEQQAMARMMDSCQQFIENATRLLEAITVDGIPG